MKIQLVILGLLFCAGCSPTINPVQEYTYEPMQDYATRIADEEKMQRGYIDTLKTLLPLKTSPQVDEEMAITVYTFGWQSCRILKCRKDTQGWKGTFYKVFQLKVYDSIAVRPHNGWENLESQLQQLGIKDLPSQADYRAEPNTFRPGDKEETVIILDGTSTCIEVQSKELNHYGWYDNIEGYAEARPNSSMLQRMSKIVKLLDQEFLPK